VPVGLTATGVAPAPSASATVPSVKGEVKCNPTTGKYDITWTVGGDTGVPKETATIVSQSRPTAPTLVNKTVKNTSTVTGSESVSAAGTYTLEVKVQWTNHAKGDLVTQKGSVKVSGTCAVPPAPPTQTVTCDVITGNYNRPLTNGDHINATITPPGSQVNMYVDQNVAGGASYNGQNNLGLRWKILGVEQTPIPLTLEQVKAGIITLPYGAELQKTQSVWTVSFVQTNETDTWPEFNCNTNKEDAVASVSVATAETCYASSTVAATLKNAKLADGQVLDQSVGTHTVSFKADRGHLFAGGLDTFPVTYTIKAADPSLCPQDATASVSIDTAATCYASSTVKASVKNATLGKGEVLDQSVGAHTVTYVADATHLFPNGKPTLEVSYTILAADPSLCPQEAVASISIDKAATCELPSSVSAITAHASLADGQVLDQSVGAHTVTFKADDKFLFTNGKPTLTVDYTIEAANPSLCPVVITKFAAATAVDKCGVNADELNVPKDTDEVSFKTTDARINGVGSATVEAFAKTGYVFNKDAVTKWTFEFTNVPCPVVITSFAAASSVDKCGVQDDKLNVPADTDKVSYATTDNRANGVGAAVVTATAKTGYVFPEGAVTSWTFEFTNEACIGIITKFPAATAVDKCGIKNDELNVPKDTDEVRYVTTDTRVNGVGAAKVEAFAKTGFEFEKGAVTSWTFTFTDEACESTTPPVEPPVTTPTPTPTPTSTPTPTPVSVNPPATPPTPHVLASTGADIMGIVTIGALLLLVGAAFVAVQIRRRRNATNE